MRASFWWAAPVSALFALSFNACGGDSAPSNPPSGGRFPDASGSFDASAPPADSPPPPPPPPPPEVEERRTFQTPQAGGRFVYVANPTRDSVAVIDSRSLAIQTVEAGDGPTFLTTVPARDVALVINVSSHTLTILRTSEAGVTTTTSVPVVAGANALAVAPDGRHAIAYLDTASANAGLGTGSFQDISLVTLDAARDTSVQLSVGFRPVEVLFSADGASGFVVTEDGVSILRFAEITGPTIIPNVSLDELGPIAPRDAGPDAAPDAAADAASDGAVDAAADAAGDATADADAAAPPDAAPADAAPADAPPLGQVPARDISITRDGRYAIARVEGTSTLRLIDLSTRAITAYAATGAVTDLDIAPDGSYALAVVRERSEVLRIPIPAGFSNPAMVTRVEATGEFVGSVTFAPDGSRALLYTTALPLERVTLMDLGAAAPALQVIRLRKAVRAVAFSPDSRSALLVHSVSPGSPDDATVDLETRIDRSYGYTLLDVGTRFTKLQLTPSEVGPFAIVTDGSHAFVLLRDDGRQVAQAQRASLRSFAIDTLTLGSPPSSVGVVSGTQRAFIGQNHPEGRITFVDWQSGALQSVTGFELNSRIVD